MTLKGGTSQACAACKYQRRKCTPECRLAPYFPPDQPKIFQNAHKLFGVRNILNILKNLHVSQHGEAMRSIIFQANIRDRFPVHGCSGFIQQLSYQLWMVEEELHLVNAHLERLRNQQFQIYSGPSQLDLGMAPPNIDDNSLLLFQQDPQDYNLAATALQQHSYSVSSSIGNNSVYLDSKDNEENSLWVQQQFATNNTNPTIIQSPMVASKSLAIQHVDDFDAIQPFFDAIDDRQSCIISKEAYESSSEESLKDTRQHTEHVEDDELKNAAAYFSLTSAAERSGCKIRVYVFENVKNAEPALHDLADEANSPDITVVSDEMELWKACRNFGSEIFLNKLEYLSSFGDNELSPSTLYTSYIQLVTAADIHRQDLLDALLLYFTRMCIFVLGQNLRHQTYPVGTYVYM
ncbi:hypothetical protein ACFE04_027844 [Oxalis oulophora]